MMIELIDQKIPDVKLVRCKAFFDERGFFSEVYRKPFYEEKGIALDFVQDNHSCSVKGTIRGMHFQSSPGQAKLITVVVGKIYDVFVDIRQNSPTFGKWGSCILDASASEPRPEGRGMIWKGLRTPPKCNFELPDPKGPGFPFLDEQLYIPVGFAHGFATLSDVAHVLYKVSSVFDPAAEKTFHYNDPKVGIDWPFENPILSERDNAAPSLEEVLS